MEESGEWIDVGDEARENLGLAPQEYDELIAHLAIGGHQMVEWIASLQIKAREE